MFVLIIEKSTLYKLACERENILQADLGVLMIWVKCSLLKNLYFFSKETEVNIV